MKTPAGRECEHFYGDYFRGRNVEECRLLKSQGQDWTRDLCKTCPVPEIARANSCQHMRLKVTVGRPFTAMFQRRVQITAFCEKTKRDVNEPQIGCGECHALPFKFEVKDIVARHLCRVLLHQRHKCRPTTMTLTLLLDLDDTLLNTNQPVFIPAYFRALAKELAPQVAPEIMMRALLSGMNLMNASDDFSHTLKEVFETVFLAQINVSPEKLEPAIENFYDNVFPTLQGLTSQKPEAKPFVDWALSQGFRIAIATDPLLPRKATYHRLRWAGFEPEQFEIISSFEHFYFSKTHPAYYAEVLGRMGWAEGPVLMVGNDMDRDIIPAQKLGLAAYHVDGESAAGAGDEARGTLSDLRVWLESMDVDSLIPSFKSVDSVLGILSATPAVMNGLSRGLDASLWSREPTPDDWALTEIVCHLRDAEREIHHLQIRLFKEQSEPFIPRPDTSVWASQRDYLHENGTAALKEFNEARRETLDMLKNISADEWNRKARHAIFGPTNFLEVVRFIADHDRMHIQQAWSLLKKL